MKKVFLYNTMEGTKFFPYMYTTPHEATWTIIHPSRLFANAVLFRVTGCRRDIEMPRRKISPRKTWGVTIGIFISRMVRPNGRYLIRFLSRRARHSGARSRFVETGHRKNVWQSQTPRSLMSEETLHLEVNSIVNIHSATGRNCCVYLYSGISFRARKKRASALSNYNSLGTETEDRANLWFRSDDTFSTSLVNYKSARCLI